MNWYYVDGPERVGPIADAEWEELVRSGKIQPVTLVWRKGLAGWVPYREAALPPPPPEAEAAASPLEPETKAVEEPESGEAFAARVLERDFPVNIGDCLSRAWGLFTAHFGMLFGATFFIFALLGVGSLIPGLGQVIQFALQGVLMGGLYCVFLRLMRGHQTGISDLFAGFQPGVFRNLVLQTLTVSLVGMLFLIPAGISSKMTGVNMNNFAEVWVSDPMRAQVQLLVVMTCFLPAIYFSFCWMFSIPLIIDKGMRFWAAMQLSRRKVLQHPWRIGVFSLVAGCVGCVGIIGLGIGIIFTLPLSFAMTLYLYEEMFGEAVPSPTAPEANE